MKPLQYLILFIIPTLFFSCSEKEYKRTIKQDILTETDLLEKDINTFIAAAEKNAGTRQLQAQYKKSKLQYKKLEWAVEYFIPASARFMNGPALDELELEENREFPPHGFQVIEELLFPEFDNSNQEELVRELKVLLNYSRQIRKHFDAITISPDYVMDATRLQVYRIITLSITGFDSPVAFLSIPETSASLAYIPVIIEQLDAGLPEREDELRGLINNAVAYCDRNRDFNRFNRAEFITTHLNPISKKLYEFQKAAGIRNVVRNRALKADAAYLFAENAFDVDAFIPSQEYKFTPEKAELGKMLFYDNALSKDNNRSCATCHKPDKAFTDGLKTNISLTGINLRRNTPALTYASLQHGQFWDLRQPDLEKQTVDVIQNREEMHGSMDVILNKIIADSRYKEGFKKAFKTDKPEAWQVQNALASYVRSLNSFDSRFDDYMRGNSNSLTAEEIEGMNLFMGKAKCATCHFTPIFNGTVPPNFVKTEHEVIGTPKDKAGRQLSDDNGRYIFNKMPQLKGAFKTPGLRNVAITAPYMHNGVFDTLEEVVDFYNKGGGLGMGLPAENQTLPFDKLSLTDKEMKALVAFMKTLTDKQYEK
ncbi:cytochrome-c peroxidase [Flavobacterium cyanobacteriorum]|uniref:Cytochrome-c peroxidase n=1 Tax=Flavobacterium cyanobacteriorum TaxID=2022802 RepID=A0A255ZDF0_9FLAO|nr:cytochrome c peroxidase [Flavobacterium cyanobacteriorum]OYQ39587.1 cytochrome-c peroxidase [Flavobacterium cyanobacteriorum]